MNSFCHELSRRLQGRIASPRIAIFGNRPRNFGAVGRQTGPMGGHQIYAANLAMHMFIFFGFPSMPKLAGVIHSAHLSPKNYPQFRKGQYPPTQLEPLGQGSEVSRPSAMQHVSPLFATDLQEGVRTERSVEKCTKAGTCVKCHVKMFAFYLFLGSQKQRCAFFFLFGRHSKVETACKTKAS